MTNPSSAERGIQRAVDYDVAQHYVNSPAHGAALVDLLFGHVAKIAANEQTDPALLALDYLDSLAIIASLVIKLEKWCVAVRDATPEQLFETGAQPCHD